MKRKNTGSPRNVRTLTVIILMLAVGLGAAYAKERKHGKELTIQKKMAKL